MHPSQRCQTCASALFMGLWLSARAAGRRLAGRDINAEIEELVKFQYLGLDQSLSYKGQHGEPFSTQRYAAAVARPCGAACHGFSDGGRKMAEPHPAGGDLAASKSGGL